MGVHASEQTCATLCAAGGFEHFGLQYMHECFRGNTFGNRGGVAPQSECDANCDGDPAATAMTLPVGSSSQMCGTSWRNNMFTITDRGQAPVINTEIEVNYLYEGCYIDVSGSRDIGTGAGNDEGSFHTMSAQASIHTCAEICNGFSYFGLQYHNQCFCGNTHGTNGHDTDTPSGCNTPCNHPGLQRSLGSLMQVRATKHCLSLVVPLEFLSKTVPFYCTFATQTNPSCEGTWEPACDIAAETAGIAKPEICGGGWRNSVYSIMSNSMCQHAVNGALDGPVYDNSIAGWDTHNCNIEIVDYEGRTGVLHNIDAGGFSDVYQTINTVPGTTYTISYDVYTSTIEIVDQAAIERGDAYCTSTDSNGLLAINAGALAMGCNQGGYCDHGDWHACPDVPGQWTTVRGSYTATSPLTTLRLHGEATFDVYFDNFQITGRCTKCNLVVNSDMDGPVVDNTIAGWESQHATVSLVDFGGEWCLSLRFYPKALPFFAAHCLSLWFL